jgi:FkbM family methyltransferase
MVSRLKRLGLHPRTVIDVGANVGQFAVAAGKLFKGASVHSFEPLPDCYLRLQTAASKMTNIRAKQLALGDRIGELEFHVNSHRHSSSVLRLSKAHKLAFPEARESATITVPTTTLDEEYAGTELAQPVLLKLDVQGYEATVLRGARSLLSRVDHVLLELSLSPLYEGEPPLEDVLALLCGLNFELRCAVDFLVDPLTGAYIQMDGLFSRRSKGSGPDSPRLPAAPARTS